MQSLVILGLALDFVGVALLGFDLVRLQIGMKRSAERRLAEVRDVLDEYREIGDWVEDIAKNAYWTEFHNTEGFMYEPSPGTFDPAAAQASFKDAMDAVSVNALKIEVVGKVVMAGYQEDQRSANASLWVSFTGLALILVGFSLQILAQF